MFTFPSWTKRVGVQKIEILSRGQLADDFAVMLDNYRSAKCEKVMITRTVPHNANWFELAKHAWGKETKPVIELEIFESVSDINSKKEFTLDELNLFESYKFSIGELGPLFLSLAFGAGGDSLLKDGSPNLFLSDYPDNNSSMLWRMYWSHVTGTWVVGRVNQYEQKWTGGDVNLTLYKNVLFQKKQFRFFRPW